MPLYPMTILLGSFLLFQVQPIIAKIALPWFGGSASVWSTCLLFFQGVLLLGYAYAHAVTRFARPRAQARIHGALLLASLLLLPILPGEGWKPIGSTDPVLRLLALLAATVGLPYFALTTTSPLIQAWFAREKGPGGALAYRLFALSNAGSMAALLSYPFVVEPLLGSGRQALLWSGGYALFAVVCAATAFRAARREPVESHEASPAVGAPPPGRVTLVLWLALPACASVLLLSITSHLSQNVAPVPFLWVVPLSLYLLSFVLCFERDRWYVRAAFLPLQTIAVGVMAYTICEDTQNALRIQALLPVCCAGLFICCMFCHGEVARLRPHPRFLTLYYLLVAGGGALGGVFATLLAPRLFPVYLELPLGMAACAALALLVIVRDRSMLPWPRVRPAVLGLQAGFAVALAVYLGVQVRVPIAGSRVAERNFYGALRVTEAYDEEDGRSYRTLTHGTINHGEQFTDPSSRRMPLTYYGTESGVGLATREGQRRPNQRVGVLGLGAGTMAAYGRPGDTYRFYEIDPLVVRLARLEFSYLGDSPARTEVILGDARLSLEREPPQGFDLLVMDAFSSDAIPVHLLTREALELYFRHLKPGGVLAINISNRYLDLQPVLKRAAEALGKEAVAIDTDDAPEEIFGATWVLMSGRRSFFEDAAIRDVALPLTDRKGVLLWTDDYSNLFRILKW